MSKCSPGYSTPQNTGTWDGSGLQGLTTSPMPAAEQELKNGKGRLSFLQLDWTGCGWQWKFGRSPCATLWGSSSRAWWNPAWGAQLLWAHGIWTSWVLILWCGHNRRRALLSDTKDFSSQKKQQGHESQDSSKSFRVLVYAGMPGWMKQIQSTLCWFKHSVKSLNFKSCSQTLQPHEQAKAVPDCSTHLFCYLLKLKCIAMDLLPGSPNTIHFLPTERKQLCKAICKVPQYFSYRVSGSAIQMGGFYSQWNILFINCWQQKPALNCTIGGVWGRQQINLIFRGQDRKVTDVGVPWPWSHHCSCRTNVNKI